MKIFFSLVLLASMGSCFAVGEWGSSSSSLAKVYSLATVPAKDRHQLKLTVGSIEKYDAPIQSKAKQFEMQYIRAILSKYSIACLKACDEDLLAWIKTEFKQNPLLAVDEHALCELKRQVNSIILVAVSNGCPNDYDWSDELMQEQLDACKLSTCDILTCCVPEFDAYVEERKKALNEMSDEDPKKFPYTHLLNCSLKEGSTLVIKTSMLLKRLEKAAE